MIGPMGRDHLRYLQWLADDVVAPILGDEFEVFTPDVNETGNIMNHVIKSADRSTLVVADMTNNNPNVLYEIAVLDAMGRLCIPVKMIEDAEEVVSAPYDRAAYRYFKIQKGDTEEAIEKLRPVIDNALRSFYSGELPENPLTDFFGFPLSTLSSAHGLARGYYSNFIKPALKGKLIKGPKGYRRGESLPIECVIPDRIDYAKREAIEQLRADKKIFKVSITAPGRPIEAYVWNGKLATSHSIVDIPTAFSQLRDNVISRLGRNANHSPETDDFKEIEADEIAQFVRFLQWHQNVESGLEGEMIRSRLRIVRARDCSYPQLFG